MKYARIENGVVAELIDLPDGATLADCFHPDIASKMFSCPDSVGHGWAFADGTFSEPAPPEVAAPTTDALVAYAAAKRWQIEVGGISVGGIDVATDDRSKIMLMGARVKADSDPAFSTRWKTQGGFSVLTAGEIIAISDAVLAHVDACFEAEATVLDDIEAGTITTTEAIDAAFAA